MSIMKFIVPKFIEHKAKIVGPLTLVQSIYLGSAVAIAFTLYFILPLSLFILVSIIIIAVGAALAFANVNGVPLSVVLKSFVFFSLGPKIYLWQRKASQSQQNKKREIVVEKKPEKAESVPQNYPIRKSRLKNLSIQIETEKK